MASTCCCTADAASAGSIVSPAPVSLASPQPSPSGTPAPKASGSPQGQWSAPFFLANVAIHAHLLHNKKVLFWGRRNQPTTNSFASLNEWETHAFLLDLETMKSTPTSNQPTDQSGKTINLFCSSHTFLPDGRLMVTGGHLFDSQGIDCATIYDPDADRWSAADAMHGQPNTDPANSLWQNGRWYPTAITLADGSVFVCSGTLATAPPAPAPNAPTTRNNSTPEIWDDAPWKQLTPFVEATDLQQFLFPRFHLAPDGRVFLSGPGPDSFFFDTSGKGTWAQSATRPQGPREYAPSVMYEVGKIVFIGGGNDPNTNFPSQLVWTIDLNDSAPAWQPAQSMHFRRRQHNATLLPDGTVLVTGGTQGNSGAGGQGFNDLSKGQPIHAAELWDPKTGQWTLMAEEHTDRCYHSTAVLLPDGRVMTAGGGEYQPTNVLAANDPNDSHLDAQIFSPPYLLNGPRPQIEKAPDEISYGQTFPVTTSNSADIGSASLVRTSSVTHSFNTGQRINFLALTTGSGVVNLTAPPNANVCPPGYYLLFLLNKAGVPSEAQIVKVIGEPAAPARFSVAVVDQAERNQSIIDHAKRPEVVVGLTPTCPYGLATCWAGAQRALKQLDGVETVRPIAENKSSVAFLYLDHDGLPDLAKWQNQFTQLANGSYTWRGVEMTLAGPVSNTPGGLTLTANTSRPAVLLAPLQRADKVQIDQENGVAKPLPPDESGAYASLAADFATAGGAAVYSVTGPLKQTSSGYLLEVRSFRKV